jgi:hypothetical protein
LLDGKAKAYPLDALKTSVVHDSLGDVPVVLILGDEAPETNEPAGRSVRAYRGLPGVALSGSMDTLTDADGATWTFSEAHLAAADGRRMERLPGHLAFWFGWFAYFPDTAIYGAADAD